MPGIFSNFLHNLRTFGLEYFGRFYGIYRGVCTVNKDPDNQGRIKVKVHTVFGDREISAWAYPVFRAAGNQYGEFWPPEEQDGVLVTFEFGNPRLPMYVGGWYAKDEMPTEFQLEPEGQTVKSPTARGWITKGGHQIVLQDKQGDEKITVKWAAGQDFSTLVIDKNGIELKLSQGAGLKINGKDANAVTTLGDGAVKAAIADHLEQFYAQIKGKLDAFDAHIHPSSMGPTGAPNPMIQAPQWDSKINSSKLVFPDG